MADLGLIARTSDADERRALWRKLIASIGEEEGAPSPLEGVPAEEIAAAVRTAVANGLLDDVDFLDSPRAGAALYALASAIPAGAEQRELGRRVLARIATGDAHVFVAIATSMALAGGKPFQTAAVRTRMVLACEMPLAQGLNDGPLALAVVGRRQLARDWVVVPSMGSLPARRLSARLLERAACEAARFASRGDPHALRALFGEAVSGATSRLFADRESLVWRHVAIARGVLAPFIEGGLEALDADVRPDLSPTEWRRAATSIGALVGVDPDQGARRAHALLHGPVFERDRGTAAAIVWGCTRALDLEPDAAKAILREAVKAAPIECAEAMSELVLDWAGTDIAKDVVRSMLEDLAGSEDDEARAIARHLDADIAFHPDGGHDALRHRVTAALSAFGTQSIQAAVAKARPCIEAAGKTLAIVRKADESSSEGRRTILGALRDLDVALLQGPTLVELARLEEKLEESLDQLREDLGDWILARPEEAAPGPSIGVDLRALRTLVHLVDSDLGEEGEGGRSARLRKRWGRIAAKVLARFESPTPHALRRATSAALARAVDALVRADAIDPVDAVLASACSVSDVSRFEVISEASMDPGVRHAMARYAELLKAPKSPDALDAWARDLVPEPSSRAETLRRVLLRLSSALRRVLGAGSLRDLSSKAGTEADLLQGFEKAVEQLERMTRGARGRLGRDATAATPARGSVAVEVARVLSGAQKTISSAPLEALKSRAKALPRAVGEQCLAAIEHVAGLPADAIEAVPSRRFDAPEGPTELPAWLPPRRTLGGFYVERRLGSGGVGSVFVAVRVEDRGTPEVEHFALKVPDYSAAAARTLSEAEFLQMFRSEASALIALPHHPNLARFVTFDSGSRPKPILVMELVEGASFEHVIEARALETPRALAILDDVLAGLEAMHAVGVGHLDVKPSNVLLRARGGKPGQAVLVDFGLAGRRVRPGCATGAYGAPEVWVPPEKEEASPLAVDVYAFGCLAYEALTGRVLFAAQDEVAQIGVHLAHDGSPEPIRAMSQRQELAALAELLFSTLRRDPKKRPNIGEVRATLGRLGKDLAKLRWPVDGVTIRR